jgi:hypothetical protein
MMENFSRYDLHDHQCDRLNTKEQQAMSDPRTWTLRCDLRPTTQCYHFAESRCLARYRDDGPQQQYGAECGAYVVKVAQLIMQTGWTDLPSDACASPSFYQDFKHEMHSRIVASKLALLPPPSVLAGISQPV